MTKRRILIIDDEPLIRQALAEYLMGRDYAAATAANGAEGLDLARAEQFDAVLVDLRMPCIDGLETIATLEAEQPHLPLIAISGAGALSDAIQAIRQGAWDYLAKPIEDIDQITLTLERVLDRARLIAERDRYQRELERINNQLEAEVAQQTQELRAQNRLLVAVNYVSYAITSAPDLGTTLNRAVNTAINAVQADGGMIHLLNPATNHLVVAVAHSLSRSYLASARAIPLGQGLIGAVAASGFPNASQDMSTDPWLAPLENEGFQTFLGVPLRSGDQANNKHPVVGVLGILARTEHDYGAQEIDLLAAIGNQVGMAVARAQYAADLEQANAELERANIELRHMDNLREQFIQNVAHELRTPLTMVLGYVEMLTQNDLDQEERAKATLVAFKHVQKLTALVESVTTLQDLKGQAMNMGPIQITALLQTASQMIAQRALALGIEIHTICPPGLPPAQGDFTRLAQAIHQLLDNACKFSPGGSTVTLDAQLAPAGDAICISVTDQGIGISSQEHNHIFDHFYQIDGSTTRRYGGTGLGLAIVKEIAHAHKGQVIVTSPLVAPEGVADTAGQGSKLTIVLPLQN